MYNQYSKNFPIVQRWVFQLFFFLHFQSRIQKCIFKKIFAIYNSNGRTAHTPTNDVKGHKSRPERTLFYWSN